MVVNVTPSDDARRIAELKRQIAALGSGVLPAGGTGGQLLAKASNADFDATWIAPPNGGGALKFLKPRDYGYTRNSLDGQATTTQATTGNRIRIAPWPCPFDLPVTTIVADVATAAAGGKFKIVIYDSDDDGWPTDLLFEGAELTSDTATFKTDVSINLTLTGGKMVWLGVRTGNVAITMAANQRYSAIPIPYSNVANNGYSSFQQTLLYANPTPDPWVFDLNDVQNTNPLAFWFR